MTIEMTREQTAPEIPLSLRQISELPEVKKRITYGTLRTYVGRYRDRGFPKAAVSNAIGNGIAWYPSQIIFFLKHMPDNRGAKNHKNGSERAKLGHRNRAVRNASKCNECEKLIAAGEECIEYTPDNSTEIELYHMNCALIRRVWDGS
jgi:hypothetical protein